MFMGIPPMIIAMAEVDQEMPWYKRMAGYRHGIAPHATIPQALANAWTEVMVEAVRAFHEPEYSMQPAIDYVDNLTDEMVEKRIEGYQAGYDKEYSRRETIGAWDDMARDEGGRYEKERYVFADLPRLVKRAVVSHWDRIHHEWMVEHPNVHYAPELGYFWVIENCVIKLYEPVDAGKPPTEIECKQWESMGSPGGLTGWMLMQASRGAGQMEPIYTAYGDYMD